MTSRPLTPDEARALKWRQHKRQRIMVRRSLGNIAERAVEHYTLLHRIDFELDGLERQVTALIDRAGALRS